MITKFTIDRAHWANGGNYESAGPPALLNINGNMCCLGFLGLACGLDKNQLENDNEIIVMPSDTNLKMWPNEMIKHENSFAIINDDKDLFQEEREMILTSEFKKVFNIDVEFVGKYENASG